MHSETVIAMLSPILLLIVLAIIYPVLAWLVGVILIATWLPIPSQDGMYLFHFLGAEKYIAIYFSFILLFIVYQYSLLWAIFLFITGFIGLIAFFDKHPVI